ncbi:MAG: propionaldehyde dehydrogenase [Bacillota bacterium]|nr:propionaldehyde dehydrogenase [Bacillota bacterium]MDK2855304.1 propionaldehyde dehydrogenase [Bacillota bacterium]
MATSAGTLDITEVVRQVMARLKEVERSGRPGTGPCGVYASMEEAIQRAEAAQKKVARMTLEEREKCIAAIRATLRAHARELSEMAVQETGMGRVEDKIIKNNLVADKTPGTEDLITEAWSGDRGLTLVEMSPFGVIGAITPSTNPTETVFCNAIGMFAAGNSVVFSPHPGAKAVSLRAVELINQAIQEAGGPEDAVTSVAEPSIEAAQVLFKHPAVRLLVATGGPGVVHAALTSGKKAIGAGAGNPPVVVDETADIEKAGHDIIAGGTFDNNLPCIAEKEIIAVESVADYLLFNLLKNGAVQLKDRRDIDRLAEVVLTPEGKPSRKFIGRDAAVLLKAIGKEVPPETRGIVVEVEKEHPFVQEELMMPILPLVRVRNVDEAIEFAVEVEHGNRHTAIMHSKNVDNMTRLAREIQTTIFVKNGPSYAGIGVGGEGFATFTIAGPTGEGLTSARTFTRKRRCVLVDAFSIR